MADPTVPNPMVPQDPSAPMQPMPPAAPTKPGLSARSPLVAGIAGLVVGAVAVGIPWLLSGTSSASAFGADKAPLKAPPSIAGFTQLQHHPKFNAASLKVHNDSDPQSAKNLSAAYGGAAVVVQPYADADVANFITLEAVRAQSPLPYVPYVDAQDLGLAKPDQEIETFGKVSCLVATSASVAGQPVSPDNIYTVSCERTSAHLTVRLRFGGSTDLTHSPQQAAALVDTAWNLVS